MPKVSVIVPVYGVEMYIERCVRSLFEQTLDDIEFLFIDDCTPDKSIEILKSVLEEYPKRKEQVIIHRMKQNSGQAKVREWGMRNATGEFVIHCDSDDWVDLDMYRYMYETAKNEVADIAICDFVRTDGELSNIVIKSYGYSDVHEFIRNCIFTKNSWALWNKMIKRELYLTGVIYPTENLGEDMVLCLQLLAKCKKIAYVNIPFYKYFCNKDSITRQKDAESVEKHYLMLKSNTDIVIELIKNGEIPVSDHKFTIGFLRFLNVLKLKKNLYLKKNKDIWKSECKQISFIKFMLSRSIPFSKKKTYLYISLYIFLFVR